MDLVTDIENHFENVKEISFRFSIIKDTPEWVSICADDHKMKEEVISGYYMLYDHFKNDKCVLIIYDRQFEIDISIMNERTMEIINIKHLKFDIDEMEAFLKYVPNDKRIDLRVEYAGTNILYNYRPNLYFSAYKKY